MLLLKRFGVLIDLYLHLINTWMWYPQFDNNRLPGVPLTQLSEVPTLDASTQVIISMLKGPGRGALSINVRLSLQLLKL